ncbi:MAG: hypothetical protein GY739_19755, partial [Mesoflavibacter sp.]|nr:hypothetical protein [Mesoflavibacter sp.]
ADTTSTYYTRLIETVGDKKIVVVLYKDGDVIFNGFLKPDGIYESFVIDFWVINVQAIDGLGLLENIKFLNEDGNPYIGNYKELELLARCLELTGQTMDFRIYHLNLFFSVDEDAPLLSNQPFYDTYVNTERYRNKDKDNTVFTVKKVLEGLLLKYGCFITQQDGCWHIVRIIDYFQAAAGQPYSLYDVDGTYINGYSALMNMELGSDINDFDPCHATGNQSKFYKAALGAYKVTYEYGFVKSIITNDNVFFNDNLGDITGWELTDPATDIHYEFHDAIQGYPSGYYTGRLEVDQAAGWNLCLSNDYTTYPSSVSETQILQVNIKTNNKQRVQRLDFRVQITLIGDSGNDYFLNSSGEWTTSSASILCFSNGMWMNQTNPALTTPIYYTKTRGITTNGLPEDGVIRIWFYKPRAVGLDYGSWVEITDVDISGADESVKGESWTSRRLDDVTAIIDTEDKIYVGDNDSDVYIGAIEDATDNSTLRWSKTISGVIDSSKQYPILNWMSRDRLTISGGNATTFKGGISGYLP